MKAIVAVLLVTVFSQANAATVGYNAACSQSTNPDTCDTGFTCMKASGCTQGTCQCTSPTVYSGSACLTPVKITEACTDDVQCPHIATCVSSVCTCASSTQTVDNMKCLVATDLKIGVTCTPGTDTCYSYFSGTLINVAGATDCVIDVCDCVGAYKTVSDHCEHIALDDPCAAGDCDHLGDAECVGTPLVCKCKRGVEPFTGMCPTAAYTGGYNLAGQDCLTPSANPFAMCVKGTTCMVCPEETATATKCRGTINADAASLLNTCLGQTDGGGGGGSGVVGLAASLITVGLSTLFTLM